MNYLLLAVAALSFSWSPYSAVTAQSCPYGNVTRSEWRTLSRPTKQEYLRTVLALQERTRENRGYSYFDELAQVHYDYGTLGIHQLAQFLPWHRYFIWIYENALQDIARKGIALPYWNWSMDSQAPENGPIWGDDDVSIGRNGGRDGCVRTGAFSGFSTIYPVRDCLRRNFVNGRLGTYLSSQALSSTLSRARSYDDFRARLEGAHDTVHFSIGGNMGVFYSPSDPVFYFHHANIDRIWDIFQKARPDLNIYSGAVMINGQFYQASDRDILYPYEASVSQLMDISILCYRYASVTMVAAPRASPGISEFDQLVQAIESADPQSINLGAYDRTNLFRVHLPQPLPEEWIQKNGYNETQIRAIEAEFKEEILKDNLENGIPQDAIWNNDEALRTLLLKELSSSSFIVSVGKFKIKINLNTLKRENLVEEFRQQVFIKVKEIAKTALPKS